MDGGNTEQFINEMLESWGEGVLDLRSHLLSESPNLTQEVLLEVAGDNLLPQAMLLEVLIANPGATNDLSFLDYLQYEKPNPMSESMIDLIKESWTSDTYPEAIERSLSAVNQERVSLCNSIIHHILADSSRTEYDSLRTWIYRIGTIESRYDLIEFLLGNNDTTVAANMLGAIPQDFELTYHETDQYNLYTDLYNFKIALKNEDKEINQLDSIEISELLTIAGAMPNSFASMRAQNALCFFYNLCEPPIATVSLSENKIRKPKQILRKEIITAYPNPANEFIIFEYGSIVNNKVESLTITDMTGKKRFVTNLRPEQHQYIYDPRDINNGTYLYTITTQSGARYIGKISVQK